MGERLPAGCRYAGEKKERATLARSVAAGSFFWLADNRHSLSNAPIREYR
jgi:hypothetical protein